MRIYMNKPLFEGRYRLSSAVFKGTHNRLHVLKTQVKQQINYIVHHLTIIITADSRTL